MRKAMIRRTFTPFLLIAALAASGCVRLGSKPPERLLGITASVRVQPGTVFATNPADALFVEQPIVSRALATQRVAVRVDATSFAYVRNALWVDAPARQFQTLLSETIAARANRLVLDPAQYPATPARTLHGELIDFTIDAAHKQAIVTFDASLIGPDGKALHRQRFAATAPVHAIDAASVAAPLNAAANDVAGQVADWVKAQGGE
jgi:cholesterol transport system auxiliary component